MSGITVRVPEPEEAAGYYAELLGGEVVEGRVSLGSSTGITLERGSPGLVSAALDLAGELDGVRPDSGGGVVDPDGWRFEVRESVELAETLAAARPRLGHLTFESPDPLRQQAFYESLGFRTSEGLGEVFRWLRCNPIHHTLAFSKSDAPRLHHIGIELPDRDALISACDHISQLGHEVQYGPGRHLVGGNIFVYFLDRHGIRFELFCELERVEDPDRAPVLRETTGRSKSINVWGPQPPDSYWHGT